MTKLAGHRMTFLIGVLVLVIVLGAANYAHVAWLERELRQAATVEEARLREQGLLTPGQDSVVEVSAAKRWVVFGPVIGKAAVHTRVNREDGSPAYGTLDLFYERRDSGWVQVESGYCTGSECVPAAARAFAQAE